MASKILAVSLDTEQPRVARDRIAALISGKYEPGTASNKPMSGWSQAYGTKDGNDELLTWIDPVTGTLMLTPAPLLKAWNQNNSGIYERLTAADYTLTGSAWNDDAKDGANSNYLTAKDSSVNEAVITTATYGANRGFYLSWYVPSFGNDMVPTLECGWSDSADKSAGVAVVMQAGGRIEVWKNGICVNPNGNVNGDQQTDRQFFKVLLIPFRKRELLVYSPTTGAGFTHVFEDIDENEDDPTITDATNFWWSVPTGLASVECAPISYPSDAYRPSLTYYFASPPPAAQDPDLTIYSTNGTVAGSMVEFDDVTTTFVADGTTSKARLRVDLTAGSSQTKTPFVYGVLGEWPAEIAYTDSSEILALENYTLSARLDVPESPSGMKLSLTLKAPDEIDPGGVAKLLTVSNRPIQAAIGNDSDGYVVLFDGLTLPLPWSESTSDATRRLRMDARSLWKLLEDYQFSEPTPLDGLTIPNAFKFLCTSAGIPEDRLDIEDDPTTLPIANGSRGDWSILINRGDTSAQWIERLRDAYVGTWMIAEVPTPDGITLRFASPDGLGDTSVLTVFDNYDDAYAQLVLEGVADASAMAYTRVAHSIEYSSLEPAANDVWVTGMDPRTFRPLIAHYLDEESVDPTVPPSMRNDNWLGGPRKYAFGEAILSTQTLVDAAAELLASRLTPRRYLAELTCQLLKDPSTDIPLWRGDVVTLPDGEDYRIVSLSVMWDIDDENSESGNLRTANYVCERIVEGTAKGCGHRTMGTSIATIRASHMLGVVQFEGMRRMGETGQRPALGSTVLP